MEHSTAFNFFSSEPLGIDKSQIKILGKPRSAATEKDVYISTRTVVLSYRPRKLLNSTAVAK